MNCLATMVRPKKEIVICPLVKFLKVESVGQKVIKGPLIVSMKISPCTEEGTSLKKKLMKIHENN